VSHVCTVCDDEFPDERALERHVHEVGLVG
jgi:hypothetical protein